MSLRVALSPKGVKIIEIVPPLTESELHDEQGTRERVKKFWMPLTDFTAGVMKGFK